MDNEGLSAEPVFSFPEEEGSRVRAEYEAASVILEYGSGGSTLLASQMSGKRVFSVESDRAWAVQVESMVVGGGPRSPVTVQYVDIGPTGAWGRPLGPECWKSFCQYPLSIWQKPYFRHPDVVLIDGRFRVACFATVLLCATRPVTVLFDDYVTRPSYQVVERFVEQPEYVGRMGVFNVVPSTFTGAEFAKIIPLYSMATYHGEAGAYQSSASSEMLCDNVEG